jgi:hypothetical protein
MTQEDHSNDVDSDLEDAKSTDIDLVQGRDVIPASSPSTTDTPSNTRTDDL